MGVGLVPPGITDTYQGRSYHLAVERAVIEVPMEHHRNARTLQEVTSKHTEQLCPTC